jgi:hypothetical protein
VTSRLDNNWRVRIDETKETEETAAYSMVPYFVMARQAIKFESRHCRDDQDRLFALLGLWPSTIEFPFKPKCAVFVEAVYTEFARCTLSAGALEVLDFAGLWMRDSSQGASGCSTSIVNTTLPSWAPEFRLSQMLFVQEFRSKYGLRTNIPWAHVKSQDSYGKRDYRDTFEKAITGNQIFIKGVLIDKISIASFGNKMDDPLSGPVLEWAMSSRILLHEKVTGEIYYPTDELIDQAFARTIIADGPLNINDNFATIPTLDRPDFETLLLQYHSISTTSPDPLTAIYQHKYMPVYIGNLTQIHSICSFFVTDNVLIGLEPHSIAVGDVVVKFKGMRWPFILRLANGTEDFQLVGQAYLHGYMREENVPHGAERRFSLV